MPLHPINSKRAPCHWSVTCKGRYLGEVFAGSANEARQLALNEFGDEGNNRSDTGIGANDDFEVEEE